MSVCVSCGHSAAGDFQFCPQCGTRTVGVGGGMIGRTLVGKYRILQEVGAGSMGTVYRAEHTALRRQVAIKVLHRELQVDDEALRRFQREGIAAGHLQHPNAIQMFDFDRDDGLLFLAMEFVDGKSLRERIREQGTLSWALVQDLVRQLLSVLDAAHRAGIVHRDLKPENLMVVDSEDGPLLKVLDFGLSKLVGRRLGASMLTHAGRLLGTPLYMAPEQWRGEDADHRADLHAVGLMMFEMLTGRPPFQARDVYDTMMCSTEQPPPTLREVAPQLAIPVGVEAIVQRALAKAREDRWPDAAAMLQALDAIEPDRLDTGAAVRPRARGARGARRSAAKTGPTASVAAAARARRRWPFIAAAIGLLWVAIAIWVWPRTGAAAASPLVRERPAAARSAVEATYLGLLDAADGQLRSGRAEPALDVLKDAMLLPCADPEGLLLRARARRARGQFDFAVADLDEAHNRHATWTAPLVERGLLELQRGNADAAEQAFGQVLAQQARSADGLAGRAAVLRAKGHPGEALAVLDNVPAAEQPSTVVQLQRGLCELALGHADKAIPSLVAVHNADAREWQACAALGDAYLAKNDAAAAIRQYRDALAIEDVVRVRVSLVGALLANGQLKDAASELPPKDRDATQLGPTVRALAALEQDNTDAAVTALAEPGADTDADRACLLAALEMQRGRAEQASAAAERALAVQWDHATTHLVLGIARQKLGDPLAAASHFERLCKLLPDDAFAQRACGILCMDWLEQGDVALRHFERSRQLGDDDARVPHWIDLLRDEGADAARAPADDAPARAVIAPPAPTALQRAMRAALAKAADKLRATTDLHEDHDSMDKAWEVKTQRFLVRTTHSHGLAENHATGLEAMLDSVRTTLGTDRQPGRQLPILVFPTIEEYNAFGAQASEHSSFYASYFDLQHADRPVAAAFERNPTMLRMQITHSMVHQYLADAFPQAKLPTWVDEGLAAHFALWWDYNWGLGELERLRADGKLPRLATLLRDDLPAYKNDPHPRFVTLGMLFYWLLRYREDTATTAERAPFRDHLLGLLRGDEGRDLPCSKILADVTKLDADFRAFAFPR